MTLAPYRGRCPHCGHDWGYPSLPEEVKAVLDAPKPAPQEDAKDAARYRWLRDGCNEKHSVASRIAANNYGMEWDAAIDQAMEANNAKP